MRALCTCASGQPPAGLAMREPPPRGQPITALVNPSRQGAPVGIVVKVILEDGTEIMSRERGNPLD